MKRLVIFCGLLLLSAAALAQNTVNSQLFGSSWNAVSPAGSPPQPNPWCPQDSNGGVVKLTSFRVWDDGAKWSQVETARGTYNWAKVDYVVNTLAVTAGCPMVTMYQVGSTPPWATAVPNAADPGPLLPGKTADGFGGGTQCASPGDWSCLPPSDIDSGTCNNTVTTGCGLGPDTIFQEFIYTMFQRYGTKIGQLGLGNEWDSPNFWCNTNLVTVCAGSTASQKRAVRMGWDARQIAKCFNPSVQIISWDGHVGTMPTWFHQMMGTGVSAPAGSIQLTIGGVTGPRCSWGAQTVTGKMDIDVVDEHMRGTNSTNTDPTAVIAAYNAAVSEMTTDGLLALPLFNDEYGYNGSAQAANVQIQAGYAAVGLVLQSSFSSPKITQSNWYQWDANSGPLSQTIAGLGYNIAKGWMLGSTVNNFTQAGTIYKVTGTTSGGTSFTVTWDTSKTCTTSVQSSCTTSTQAESGMTHYVDVAGVTHSISGTAPVGWQPIFLTGAGGGSIAVAPTFSPDPTGSPYSTAQNVTIATTSTGAIICYTTNGTTPATNGTTGCTTGTLYSGAITTSVGTNYKAVAGGTGFTDSTVATATYTFAASQPLLTPCCTFTGAVSVTMTIPAAPAGAFICFTTDGTRPTSDGAGNCTNGTRYSSPVSVATSQTIEAISANNGWIDNGPVIFIYHINYNLSVSVSGSGQVDSSPTGINACSAIGGVCSSAFPQGTSVTLTGAAGSGYTFIGWSGGGCIGTTPCTIALNSTTSVTATFAITTPQVSTGILHGVMLN